MVGPPRRANISWRRKARHTLYDRPEPGAYALFKAVPFKEYLAVRANLPFLTPGTNLNVISSLTGHIRL